VNLQMQIVCRDASDPISGVFAPRGLNYKQHVFVRISSYDTKKSCKLGLEEAAIKCSLPTYIGNLGSLFCFVSFGGRMGDFESTGGGDLALHGVHCGFTLHGIEGIGRARSRGRLP